MINSKKKQSFLLNEYFYVKQKCFCLWIVSFNAYGAQFQFSLLQNHLLSLIALSIPNYQCRLDTYLCIFLLFELNQDYSWCYTLSFYARKLFNNLYVNFCAFNKNNEVYFYQYFKSKIFFLFKLNLFQLSLLHNSYFKTFNFAVVRGGYVRVMTLFWNG